MKKLLLLLIVLFSFLIGLNFVSACSCISSSPMESLNMSSFVFAGKVVDITPPFKVIKSSADPIKVKFEVINVWKGDAYSTIVVKTARDSASCGFNFNQGEEYLIYATGKYDKLSVSLCSRTSLLSEANLDLNILGEGIRPDISGSNYTFFDVQFMIVMFSIMIIMFAGIVFIVLKQN